MRCFINSLYHPDRLIKHKEQLTWASNIFDEIVTVYENYPSEVILELVRHFPKLNPSVFSAKDKNTAIDEGRNLLLSSFYNTDDSWGAFLDDDVILYPESNMQFFQNINLYNDDLKGVAKICALNPAFRGVGAWRKASLQPEWQQELDFFYGWTVGSFMIIKNLKKTHNAEIYYPPVFPDGTMDFLVTVAEQLNLGTYWCRQLVNKELTASKNQMTWVKDLSFGNTMKEKRNATMLHHKAYLYNTYPQYVRTRGGKSNFSIPLVYDKFAIPKKFKIHVR